MNGHSRIRRKFLFILGVGLLCLPSVISAQTAAERARAERLAQVEERARVEERVRAEVESRMRAVQERTREVESRMRAVEEARSRGQEDFRRARQEVRRAQQVMVQVKSRIRLGVSLDGTQGVEFDGLGARLAGTLDGSPAEEAGLREGDIITHLNGQSLVDPIPQEADAGFDDEGSLPVQRLMALAQELEAGDDVEVHYLRDGSPQTVSFQTAEMDEPTITVLRGGPRGESIYRIKEIEELGKLEELAELEDLTVHLKDLQVEMQNLDGVRNNLLLRRNPGSGEGTWTLRGGEGSPFVYSLGGSSGYSGLRLAEMNSGLAEYFTSDEGLLVLEIREDSSLGLVPGDVILAIDGRAVESEKDVRRILGSYEDDEAVSFTVVRKGRETKVEGTVG